VALKQCPVRQIGQRIIMREMFDPRLDAPALGKVSSVVAQPPSGESL